LHVHEARSKEVFSFEYDEAWLHKMIRGYSILNCSLNFELALSVAKFFRLAQTEARSTIDSMRAVISTWREVAGHTKI